MLGNSIDPCVVDEGATEASVPLAVHAHDQHQKVSSQSQEEGGGLELTAPVPVVVDARAGTRIITIRLIRNKRNS
jgi:uncharacterized membrane protein